MSNPHYLNDHPERERLFTTMRWLRDMSDEFLRIHREMLPPNGSLPAGGAHIDPFARGEALARLLFCIGCGETPDQAIVTAQAEARLIFEKWNNSRRDGVVHRWVNALDDWVASYGRQLQ